MSEAVVTYAVPGISCDHCRMSIEGGLGELDGVTAVAVDVPARQVQVRGTLDDASVRSALDDLGYPADASPVDSTV